MLHRAQNLKELFPLREFGIWLGRTPKVTHAERDKFHETLKNHGSLQIIYYHEDAENIKMWNKKDGPVKP